MGANNPSLSVKAYAELLNLPAVKQLRILNDQKYPRSEPQTFRVPFYQTALSGIRAYYRSGNLPAELRTARKRARTLKPKSKRDNNLRVLTQFEKGRQAKRKLQLKKIVRCSATLSGVELRLQFDLVADESETTRLIIYNLRSARIDADTARTTLEIADWTLNHAGQAVPLASLEYVDITSGASHTVKKIRKQTIKSMKQNAGLIQTLWPTL